MTNTAGMITQNPLRDAEDPEATRELNKCTSAQNLPPDPKGIQTKQPESLPQYTKLSRQQTESGSSDAAETPPSPP